jgi:GT2 family glycosyltransferase
MITSVIPTRNRPKDLSNVINSLCAQSRLPDELIIVDQSTDDLSYLAINSKVSKFKQIKFIYIHDPKILGLVDAKRVAVNQAAGDIICFLEDDVVLEVNYIQQIELGFTKNPNMIGCSGVITNPSKVDFLYKFLFVIFHQGIFKDKRIDVHGNYSGYDNALIESHMLSGGVSAWRREVFDKVEFDVANGFHMFEDIDFSTRVGLYYGNRLFINPNARLAHHYSPINRHLIGTREQIKIRECFTYYKKRKEWPNATISFYWLLLGMLLESIFKSFSGMSFKPIQGYLQGLRDGFTKKIITQKA